MREETTKYWLKLLKTNQAVFSILSGFMVMLMIGLVMLSVSWFKQAQQPPMQPVPEPVIEEVMYVVQPGDSSWSVAEESLGDGFRYVEIEAANNLSHNQYLEVGQKLIIPQDEKSENSLEPAAKSRNQQIDKQVDQLLTSEGTTYIIQPGNSLWEITQEHYGDGLLWSKVYQHNPHLGKNPNLIYPDTKITLPPPELL